jgi:lipopolysaccharide export system permease protein
MPLFERYVLRRTARGFLLVLGALTATLWIAQIMEDLDVVTAKGQAIWVFLVMTVLALPALVQVIAPIAFMVGAIASLNSLATDSELPVIAGAGASRKAVIRPILALGIAVTIGAALAHHVLTPASLGTLRTLLTRIQTQMIATLVQEGGFRSVSDGLTMHLRSKASDGSLQGIFIDDQRDPNTSLQYTAEQGVLLQERGNAYLVLQRGDMIRNDRAKSDNNVIAFETYALDLSQIGGPGAAAGYRAKERSTLYLLNPSVDDTLLKDNPARVASEIHDRMTAPLYPIAFALISLAFLGRPRTNRQDRNWAIASAVLLCVSLRVAGIVAVQVTRGSSFAAPFMYLIPMLGIAIGGYAAMRDTAPHVPRPVAALWNAASTAGLRLLRPTLAQAGLAGTDRR